METAMNRTAMLSAPVCLAIIVAGASSSAPAADGAAPQQVLVNVKTSNQVLSAVWMRQSDSYILQVVLDRSAAATRTRMPANPTPATAGGMDRSSFFVGNTIASLRGMDPAFDCRTLTLVDGRRSVSQQTGRAPAQVSPPSADVLRIKHPQIEVWLLKADGAQIQPATYTCKPGSKASPPREDVTMSYGYSMADSAQVVAVAIRIDSDYYIDKLQPLTAPPTVQ
jgi:hypothetical protein